MTRFKTVQRTTNIFLVAVSVWGASASADLIVSLEPKDLDLNPIGTTVSAGTRIVVDVFLTADGADNPIAAVESFDLDFGSTSDTISLESFSWQVDTTAFTFSSAALPRPGAACFIQVVRCFSVSDQPLLLARLEVVVNGSGEVNAVGSIDVGGGGEAAFQTVDSDGFLGNIFSLSAGNLLGGKLTLNVGDDPAPPGGGGGGGGSGPPVDTDNDGDPDITDPDDDGDGVLDVVDDFPLDPEETVDTDGDGVGDNSDAFPENPSETVDTDGDGIGDKADEDDDGDGVIDIEDAFPLDPAETVDSDGDGVGDVADAFPFDATETVDTDGDGVGDNSDADPFDPDVTQPPPGPVPGLGSAPCGLAMIQTSIFIFLGLSAMRLSRRKARALDDF